MLRCVRTTVTLEDDVASDLAKLQKVRDESFKDTLNAALRAGLATLLSRPPTPRKSYRIRPISLGTPRLRNLDDISEVLAFGEGEQHR